MKALIVTTSFSLHWWLMDFGKQLAALRKQRAMTQQALADAVGCHVTMVRRYEAGETQPTLEVIRNMARALSVSADALVFEQDERGPDDALRLQFEALQQFDDDDRETVQAVLEGLILKHQAKQSMQRTQNTRAAAQITKTKKSA